MQSLQSQFICFQNLILFLNCCKEVVSFISCGRECQIRCPLYRKVFSTISDISNCFHTPSLRCALLFLFSFSGKNFGTLSQMSSTPSLARNNPFLSHVSTSERKYTAKVNLVPRVSSLLHLYSRIP